MIKKIANTINQRRSNHSRLLIAIDGFGGAGKSSLARNLVDSLKDAVHIELDWFHLPKNEILDDKRFDLQRLRKEVLDPFLAGALHVDFKRYNWGYLANKPERLEADLLSLSGISILIIEGCMALSPELSDITHYKIWVGKDAIESRKRGIRRDIEEYGLEESTVLEAWREWGEWEDRCLAREDRRKMADLVI